ncbi:MAG: hypothetical protein Q7W02_19195 [Candidatus Rokubacteria bacterium]|nr:hypothetical protein [Candidatus Rokubacteria bacterium]
MMDGQGQSDRPGVPTKSPNNAGQPVAEGMEGRGLAKGNPSQQNVPRAEHRDGARSALERVRGVAERDKQVRFTTLLHHVYHVEHLKAAYYALKRDAAAGVDGEMWGHYGQTLGANLAAVAAGQELGDRLVVGQCRVRSPRIAELDKQLAQIADRLGRLASDAAFALAWRLLLHV